MNYSQKQIIFQNFLTQWGKEFSQIPHILDYISSYPALKENIEDFNLLKKEEIQESQLEWISLLSKFDNSLEKDFFKSYWIPIQKDGFDYFIDLSSASFSLFKAVFHNEFPYCWYRQYLFHDISVFLASVEDSSIDIVDIMEDNEINSFNELGELMERFDSLGFAGVYSDDTLPLIPTIPCQSFFDFNCKYIHFFNFIFLIDSPSNSILCEE